MSIRVLIADDQALVRAGVRMLLTQASDIEVVGEAEDGEQAVAQARQLLPDVILMDVRMPGLSGVDATRLVTADDFVPDGRVVSVLVLTTYRADEAVYAALRAGASGFLLKDAATADLVTAIREINAGNGWLDPAVTKDLIAEFAARPTQDLPSSAELDQLTGREREVLALVASGLNNAEIAERLYLGQATVKTHVGRVFMKLGARDRVQAVVIAYQTGLVTSRTSAKLAAPPADG